MARPLLARNPGAKHWLPWALGAVAVGGLYYLYTQSSGGAGSSTAYLPAPTTGAGLSAEEEQGPEYEAGTVLPGGSVVLQ